MAASLLFLTLHFMAIRNEILRRRLRRRSIEAAREGDAVSRVVEIGSAR